MHDKQVIVGIDPGLTGAVAYLGADWCAVRDLPTGRDADDNNRIDVRALAAQLQEVIPAGSTILAVSEKLLPGGVAREGRNNTYSVAVQNRTRGRIEATIELLGLELEEVTPQKWKKLYGLTGKKDEKAQAVKAAIDLAKLLYPDLTEDLRLVKHHNRAEAVLIAHWFKKVPA
ncbi:MAG TPA: hypothetical protein VIL30_24380 [Ramlibacter sp.]|jgi:hypothetical protein